MITQLIIIQLKVPLIKCKTIIQKDHKFTKVKLLFKIKEIAKDKELKIKKKALFLIIIILDHLQ